LAKVSHPVGKEKGRFQPLFFRKGLRIILEKEIAPIRPKMQRRGIDVIVQEDKAIAHASSYQDKELRLTLTHNGIMLPAAYDLSLQAQKANRLMDIRENLL
jgi:hypothetical protein